MSWQSKNMVRWSLVHPAHIQRPKYLKCCSRIFARAQKHFLCRDDLYPSLAQLPSIIMPMEMPLLFENYYFLGCALCVTNWPSLKRRLGRPCWHVTYKRPAGAHWRYVSTCWGHSCPEPWFGMNVRFSSLARCRERPDTAWGNVAISPKRLWPPIDDSHDSDCVNWKGAG